MRNVLKMFLTGAMISVAAMQPAVAATIIDQNAFVPDPSGPPLTGRISTQISRNLATQTNLVAGQTVTAGVAGRLDSIELQGLRNSQPSSIFASTFGLTLYDGDLSAGGRIIGTVFDQLPSGGNSVSKLVNVSSLGYTLRPGQLFSFSIGLTSDGLPSASATLIIGNFAGAVPPAPPPILNFNDYARGRRFISNNGSPFIAQLNGDLGFRTYVDAAVTGIPEPQSWAMMIFGFGAVGAVMRRRRARREMTA